jgi:Divergent InlB B-repeat domain
MKVMANFESPNLSLSANGVIMSNPNGQDSSVPCSPVGDNQFMVVFWDSTACPLPQPCILVNNVNDLQNVGLNLSGNYCLANDIDATGITLTSIGSSTGPFTGFFDGQGHTIGHISTLNTADDTTGLFGYIGILGIVRNVALTNASVTLGGQYYGALAGVNEGTVSNSYVTGSVSNITAVVLVGGVVGYNVGGIIERSYSAATLNSNSACSVAGGLVGYNDAGATVAQSYATGSLITTGVCVAGGLAGYNENSTISQSYARGSVTFRANGPGGSCGFGGLVGFSQTATILQSYATGAVSGNFLCQNPGNITGGVGGLVGAVYQGTTVINSYWDTQTSGQSNSAGGTGVTTAQLTAGPAPGFDPTVWGISQTINNGYPFLLWQQQLQLMPTTPITASGPPFSAQPFTYTLSAASGSIDFSIAGVPPWLTASTTSGTTSPSGTPVAFTVNANANNLAPKTYSVTITFTNSDTGLGNTTLAASLTVSPPALQVTPSSNIVASGSQGGPFSPSSFSYSLSSAKGTLKYSITNLPSWLTVSPSSGTVTTKTASVTFRINTSAADKLSAGTVNTINFNNVTSNQVNTTRLATLTVTPKQFTIKVSASPNADGTVSGGGTFAGGASETVTAKPKSGHTFLHWTENGKVVSTSESYTFTLSANVTLVADFK